MPKVNNLERRNDTTNFEAYEERRKSRNAQSALSSINLYLEGLSNTARNAYADTYNRYKDGNDTYRADSKEWLDRTSSSYSGFQTDYAKVNKLLDEYKDYYDADWVDNVRKTMSTYSADLQKIAQNAEQENGFWSSFKNEDAYKTYKGYLAVDLEQASNELKKLEESYAKVRKWSQDRVSPTAIDRELRSIGFPTKDEGGIKALQSSIYDRRAYLDNASYAQGKGESYELGKLIEQARSSEDFAKYSAEGASIANPSYADASRGWFGQSAANPVTFTIENLSKFYANPEYAPKDFNAKYRYLKDEEVEAYNYYLAAENAGIVEKGSAQNFLKTAEEVLNRRAGEKIASQLPNNILGDILMGIYAGSEQFSSGLEGLKLMFNDNGDFSAPPITSGEYASGVWKENLSNDFWGNVRKGITDLTSTITNQVPSIMASVVISNVASPAVGSAVGAGLMGAGAAGNAYREFLRSGYSADQSKVYATLIGLSETMLERAIGGISAFGAGGAKISDRVIQQICSGLDKASQRAAVQMIGHFGAEMLSEGIEEFTQDVLEPFFTALVSGDKPENVDWEQAAYSGLLGALSAGFLNGVTGAANEIATRSTARNIDGTSLRNLVIENFTEDSLARRYAEELSDNPTTTQKARLLYEIENGFEGDMVSDLERELVKRGVDRASAHKTAQEVGSAISSGRDVVVSDTDVADALDALATSFTNRLVARDNISALPFTGSIDAETIAPAILAQTTEESTAFDIAKTIRAQGAFVSETFGNEIKERLVSTGVTEADADTMVSAFRESSMKDIPENEAGLSNPVLKLAIEDALSSNITESERLKAESEKVKTEPKTPETKAETKLETPKEANPEGLRTLLKKYNIPEASEKSFRYSSMSGEDAAAYLKGLETAFKYSSADLDIDQVNFTFKDRLTQSEIDTVKSLTKPTEKSGEPSTKSVKRGSGSVKGYNITVKELRESFNDNQKTAFRAITAVAKAYGLNVILFDSSKGDVPPELEGSNGAYSPSTRTLYLDLSAGVSKNDIGNLATYTLLQTFSHEFTHSLENTSYYREFRKFVFDKMTQQGVDVNDLIENKQMQYGIDYDGAAREVVAESMVNILSDETVLTDLYENHRNIFQKIYDALVSFIKEIKAYFDKTYAHGNTDEAKAIMDGTKYLDGIAESFVKLMNSSTESTDNVVATTGDMQYSLDSLLDSVLLKFGKDGQRTVLYDMKGNEVKKVNHKMIIETPFGATLREGVKKGTATVETVNKEVDFMVDLINQMLKIQDIDLVWAVNATLGFQPNQPNPRLQGVRKADTYDPRTNKFAGITTNSDPQYGTTIDFTTICRKTQSIIDAMSQVMMKLGRGLTEEEIVDIVYKNVHEQGEPVPCPACYVFSRWVGLGGLFNTMKSLQQKYPKGINAEEEASIKARLKADMDSLLPEIEKAQKALTGKKTAGKAREKAYKDLYAEYWVLQDKQRFNPKKFTDEDKSRMDQIKRFTDYLANWTWMNDVRLAENYNPVPDNVLFNINAGQEFANNYPESWKYRTTRGPAMGKAASPYTPLYLGQVIRGVGSPSALTDHKIGELSGDPFLKLDKDGKLTKSAQKLLDNAIKNAKKQNILGGQRLQSTSDWRFEYALDYLMAFYELQTIGSKAQLYTKVPEAVPFLASTGADINCSLIPYGDGYIVKDGKYTLVFSDVTGMHPDDAFRLSSMYDNVQPIMVGINDMHIALCMADDRITFIIPYHASGSGEERYRAMMKIVGEEVKDRVDYSPYQTENKVENATPEQLAARELRLKIITGEAKTLTEDEIKILEKHGILHQLYIRFYGKNEHGKTELVSAKYLNKADRLKGMDSDLKGNFLGAAQAEMIMPYEYWDKMSTIANADDNGKAFVEYCKSLGYHPRFSGWTNKETYNAEHDFTQKPGYWKTLIDRPMYNLDGSYHEQQTINASNIKMSYLDPVESSKGVVKKSLENNKEAIDRATQKSIEQITKTTPPDLQFQFAGEKALTADKAKLAEAKKMEEEGKNSEEVRKATGWFKSYDGKWRFEIDDSNAKLVDIPKKFGEKDAFFEFLGQEGYRINEYPVETTLSEVLEAPELYKAYPELKDYKFVIEHGDDETATQASYNPKTKTITFFASQDPLGTILHEVQHAIQDIEGFAKGSNLYTAAKDAYNPDYGVYLRKAQEEERMIIDLVSDYISTHFPKQYEQVENASEYKGIPRLLAKYWNALEDGDQEYADAMLEGAKRYKLFDAKIFDQVREHAQIRKEYLKIADGLAPEPTYARYERTAGEIEARDTSSRQPLTSPERKAKRPDIDRTDALVKLQYQRNEKYLELAKDPEKNEAELEKMVEEAAREAGYDSPKLYHGTVFFGFTKLDVKQSNDRTSFFATDSKDVAGSYSGTDEVRRISDNDSNLGIYQLYANTDNILEVDSEGKEWNHVPLGEISNDVNYFLGRSLMYFAANTRQISRYAKSAGYSGVLFKNIKDVAAYAKPGIKETSDVYVFFKPKTQVKSADPVTYDAEGNVIPLSERFNPKNNDLRYQRKITPEEYTEMEKHFGTTTNFDAAGYLLTDGKMLDFSGKHWGDTTSRSRQVDHRDIGEVLDRAENVDAMVDMIADGNIRLMPENGGINLAVMPNEAQEKVLRSYIRHFRGEVMVDYDEVGGDTVYSKSYDEGTSPETVLEDIENYFTKGVSRSELMQFHQRKNEWRLGDWEVLSRAADEVETGNYTEAEKTALKVFKTKLSALQKLQEKREELGHLYHDQAFTKEGDKQAAKVTLDQMHRLDAKIEKASNEITKVTEAKVVRDMLKRARTVIETQEREHGQDMLRRYRDRRDNAEAIAKYKKRVLKDSKELQKWIANPDDKAAKRVPDVLKNAVVNFLSLIDETSDRQLKGGEATIADAKFIERYKALQKELKENVSLRGLYSGYTDLPEDFFEEMQEIIDNVEALTDKTDAFVLNMMTSTELKQLSDTIRTIKKYIREMNAFQANAIYQHIEDAGNDTLEYLTGIRDSGLGQRGLFNYFTWTQMRPAYAFERFGKGGMAIFDELRRAQGKLAFNAAEIVDFTDKLYTDKEVKNWSKETKTFYVGGDQIDVPVAYLMSLYELMKQEDSRRHIEKHGVRFATYKQGMKKMSDKGHVLTYDVINEMLGSLTDRQKEVADALQKFMATRGAEWGNYVSVKRFGREIFTNPQYFPIASDGRHLSAAADEKPQEAGLYALLNASFTKGRKKDANNRLMVYNVFDVFANHMASMTQYNAFALPILDTLKWLNYETRTESGEPISIKDEMARVYGSPAENRPGSGAPGYAEKFITNIIKAYNGTESQGNPTDNVGLNILRKYNMAQIAYNLRVAVQQPMAIVRAASVLNGTTLSKGIFKNLAALKANIAEMEKYSGIAKLKGMGYYDTNVTPGLTKQIKHDESVGEKVGEFGMKLAEFADRATWAAIWASSKEQAKREGYSGEELLTRTADIFEEVVYKTQVVDSVLTKTEFMRNKGGIARILSSFMSEPVTTASMVVDAIEKYNRDRRKGMSKADLFKKHGANFARVATVYALNSIVLAAAEAAIDSLRDDDDDKFPEKYNEQFWKNFFEELSPFSKYPIVKDIEEMGKGLAKVFGADTYAYSPRTITGQAFDQFVKGIQIVTDKINGKQKGYTWYAGAQKLLQGISGMTGTHFGTITRELVTAWNTIVGGMNPDLKVRNYVSNEDLSKTILRNVDNPAQLEQIRAKYYKNEDEFKTGYRNAVGDAYIAGNISADEASRLLQKYYSADDAHWQIEKWNYKADKGSLEGYAKYNDYFSAVETGKNLKAVTKEYLDNGVDAKTLASQITAHFKPLYIEMSKSERTRLKGYLLNAYQILGYNRYEKSKDIDAWVK